MGVMLDIECYTGDHKHNVGAEWAANMAALGKARGG